MSYPSVLMHMCCMMHVLANVGQVVKNLFPDSCLLVYCCAGGLEGNGGQRRGGSGLGLES